MNDTIRSKENTEIALKIRIERMFGLEPFRKSLCHHHTHTLTGNFHKKKWYADKGKRQFRNSVIVGFVVRQMIVCLRLFDVIANVNN